MGQRDTWDTGRGDIDPDQGISQPHTSHSPPEGGDDEPFRCSGCGNDAESCDALGRPWCLEHLPPSRNFTYPEPIGGCVTCGDPCPHLDDEGRPRPPRLSPAPEEGEPVGIGNAAVIHPAPFSAVVLRLIAEMPELPERGVILDPFAGVGRVHRLATDERRVVGVEIEPEWAALHPDTICADALALPFKRGFGAAVTSPVYGNRMSDHHEAKDGSLRRSYTHDLRRLTGDAERELHPNNSGRLFAWQPAYWDFHRQAWSELRSVLKPGAPLILDVSDCVRSGKVVPVVWRHRMLCEELGFEFISATPIETPRMRFGENGQARVPREVVLVLRVPGCRGAHR